MQIIPNSVNNLDQDSLQLHKFSAQDNNQYGKHSDSVRVRHRGGTLRSVPLFAIPTESLAHITAFLDPVSLFALGRTNKMLHEHISDDNTWHSAFACQFLGEQPERPDLSKSALLRRCEDTWKREFVLRSNMTRRWERSRNGTVSHTPHYSPVAAMHLLSDRSYGPSLLSVSLGYGVVARSFPLNGKVLKGFISASDGFGIGNGNPNAEFTPNVTACAVATEGWTARVAFGFANGEVALASAMRVMESGRTVNRVVRCLVNEEHRGLVVDLAWDGMAIVSAAADGEVRVWDAKRMSCIYVLQDQRSVVPDPCIHVLSDLHSGVILATKQSGTVVIWVGLSVSDDRSGVDLVSSAIQITPPISNSSETKEPSRIFMDRSALPGYLCYGIHYANDMHFYRINVNLGTGQYEAVRFGDGPLAPIQSIHPFFASAEKGGRTVIFIGDVLGRVSLFDWTSKPEPGKDEVSAFRRLDVTSDGVGITAIACNPFVLAVGTARGATKVYDTLSLRLLREFSSPIPRPGAVSTPVKEIIVEKDLLLVAIGERVLAWEAKPVRPHKSLTVAKKASAKQRNAKWHKRLELAQDISDSRKAVEDVQSHERRSYQRLRAHQAALAGLGLDEQEALQYMLMLSRDEATTSGQHQREIRDENENGPQNTESVFEADFDDAESNVGNASPFSSSVMSVSRSSPRPEGDHEELSVSDRSHSSPSHSRPRHHSAEAGNVGSTSGSPEGLEIATTRSAALSVEDEGHFPAISSSASSNTSSSVSASAPSGSIPRPSPPALSSSWSARVKASSGTSSPASASPTASGSTALSSSIPVAAATSVRRSVSGPSAGAGLRPSAPRSGPSLLSETLRLYNRGEAGSSINRSASNSNSAASETSMGEEEMDEDLKLAIELSLAEALSLKEN